MATSDTRMIRIGDLGVAIALLTRIPVPGRLPARGANAAWAWPFAGLLVGGIAALSAAISMAAGLPVAVSAGICLGVSIITTGALHEDGLADVADGFWGGFDPARRLEIMRDSRIGSYGVIALVLSLGLRWSALSALIGSGVVLPVIAAAVLSRAPMAVVMRTLPAARADGLSRHVGRPAAAAAAIGVGLALVLAFVLAGPSAMTAFFACGIASAVVAFIAYQKIAGQTGDVLGAVQQISEIVVLAAFATALG